MRKRKPYYFLFRKMDKHWNLTNEFKVKISRSDVFCDAIFMVRIMYIPGWNMLRMTETASEMRKALKRFGRVVVSDLTGEVIVRSK